MWSSRLSRPRAADRYPSASRIVGEALARGCGRGRIPKGTGVHCLRHYFATLLIHNGAPVKEVQLAMGHATPMITLNTYAGEWPDGAGKTRSIVDAALGNVPSACPDLEVQP
jgi:integrase